MSKRSITLFREFMAATTNHWTFLPVVFVFAGIFEISPIGLFTWCLIGILPVLLYVAREIIQSFILQVCFLPIVFGLMFFLPVEQDVLKGVLFFIAFVYIMLSVFMSIRQTHFSKILPPFIAMGIHVITNLIIFPRMEFYRYPFILYLSMIITFISFFFAFYVDQYLIFVGRNEETSNSMPRDKIFNSGMRLSLYYLGIGTVILFFISSFAISDEFIHEFWRKLKGKLREAIKYLISLLSKQERDTHLSDGADSLHMNFPDIEQKPPSLFWQIMEIFLFALVILLLVAVFLYLLYKIYLFIRRLIPQKIAYEAEEEVESIDKHEALSPKKKVMLDEEDDGLQSIRLKIRKLYRRKALSSGLTNEVLIFSTAREVADELHNPVLPAIYEKARYSQEPCDKEDLKRLQESFRNHK